MKIKYIVFVLMVNSVSWGTLFQEEILNSKISIKAGDGAKDKIKSYIRENKKKWELENDADSVLKKDYEDLNDILKSISKGSSSPEKASYFLRPEESFSGLILQKIKELNLKGWMADYGNSIYAAEDYDKIRIPVVLYLTSSFMTTSPYAIVSMKSGWMTSSSEPDVVALPDKERIKKITLLASESFYGPRLTIWSRASVLGGVKVLKYLKGLKEYKGKWGYVYFDHQDKPICSSNIQCQFDNPRTRSVLVDWKGQ